MEYLVYIIVGIVAGIFGVMYLKPEYPDPPYKSRAEDIKTDFKEKEQEKQEEINEKIENKSNQEVVDKFNDVFSRKPGTSKHKWSGYQKQHRNGRGPH